MSGLARHSLGHVGVLLWIVPHGRTGRCTRGVVVAVRIVALARAGCGVGRVGIALGAKLVDTIVGTRSRQGGTRVARYTRRTRPGLSRAQNYILPVIRKNVQ